MKNMSLLPSFKVNSPRTNVWKIIKNPNPKTRFYALFIKTFSKNKCKTNKECLFRKQNFSKRPHRESVDCLPRSTHRIFFSLHFCFFSDPKNGPTIRTVDGIMGHRCFSSHHSLVFLQHRVVGHIFDLIDALPRWFADRSIAAHLVRILWVAYIFLYLHSTITNYGTSMGWRVVDGFVFHLWNNFCKTFFILILDNFP